MKKKNDKYAPVEFESLYTDDKCHNAKTMKSKSSLIRIAEGLQKHIRKLETRGEIMAKQYNILKKRKA